MTSGLGSTLKRLDETAAIYNDAMRRLGLAYSAQSDDRNRIACEVYSARKAFLAAIEKVRCHV